MGSTARNIKAGVVKHASGEEVSHQSKKHENDSQNHRSPLYRRPNTLLSLFLLLMTFLGNASAQKLHNRRLQRASPPLFAAPVQNLAAWNSASLLVLDTRPPPVSPLMHLQRRRDEVTTTTSASASKQSIATDPNAAPSNFKIPAPFDTSLSNNFTASCSTFFQAILTDAEFNDCHPFSLLLQTSSAFFDASKSFVRITQTLEATCKSNLTTCRNVMNDRARGLISNNNCGVDYANDNPQVLQAYNGLLAYEPLYQASCLQDASGSFCYADAVTNSSATTDSYPYYLPLGVSLPGGARPTCNSCLQDAMAIFSSFAGNSTQPVSKTYNAAAQQIDLACGPTFVNKTSIPLKGAASGNTPSLLPTISLIMVLFYFFR